MKDSNSYKFTLFIRVTPYINIFEFIKLFELFELRKNIMFTYELSEK